MDTHLALYAHMNLCNHELSGICYYNCQLEHPQLMSSELMTLLTTLECNIFINERNKIKIHQFILHILACDLQVQLNGTRLFHHFNILFNG